MAVAPASNTEADILNAAGLCRAAAGRASALATQALRNLALRNLALRNLALRTWACRLGVFALVLLMGFSATLAEAQTQKKKRTKGKPAAVAATGAAAAAAAAARERRARDGDAEARLIAIYRLIGQARTREALELSGALVRDHPNFQLAQLVHGDLLSAQARPVRIPGDVPDTAALAGAAVLADLRVEAQQRLRALRERPPAGHVPSQFVQLSARNRHAIAVDASRSRLYLFENSAAGLKLVADYYISLGKAGIDKMVEGDLRTPVGVYWVTSNLDPKTLRDFYGSGALPINYPNPLDQRQGRTGSGIWLHGTPPNQFARAPHATDGCVVLANPDLERVIRTVQVRTTPVVIAHNLQWVKPGTAVVDRAGFDTALEAWRKARSSGQIDALMSLYAPDFRNNGKTLAQWREQLLDESRRIGGRDTELKDLSVLHWRDRAPTTADVLVVTFGEVAAGQRSGTTRRQYWQQTQGRWTIIHEGIIG